MQMLQRRTEEASACRQAAAAEAVLAAATAAASDTESLEDTTSTSALLESTAAAAAAEAAAAAAAAAAEADASHQSASAAWSPVAGLLSYLLPVLKGPTVFLLSVSLAVHTVRKTTAILDAWLHAYRPYVDCEYGSF